MNSTWNKNIALFRERFPQLFQMIETDLLNALPKGLPFQGESLSVAQDQGIDFPCGWKLLPAKTGAWTSDSSLHSRYDPEKEGQRLADSISQELSLSEKTPVFMGFGLGYGIVALAKKKPSALILVEPDVACLAAALWALDFEAVFALEKCAFLVATSHQSVLGVLENFGLGKCHIIWNKAHTNHNQGYFDGLHTLIQRNLDKDDINARTLEKFGKLWQKNSCRNLHYLACCDGVFRYKDLGKNLDACVIGAGPSLDEILPHLAEIKERCIVIAVDTALRACLRVGVEPDFVVLSDPQYWNARHLAGLAAPSSVLVTEVAAHPSVFRFPCQEIVLSSSLYPVGRYFCGHGLEKGDLGAGGSVATSAWGLALLLGCQRIFLAAVDLSFPEKRTHARGSTFEEKTHLSSHRLVPSQQSQVAALYSADTSFKKSYSGKTLISDQRMELYAWWFESKVAAHSEVKTLSLTAESLAIPGIAHFPLRDFLLFPKRLQEKKIFYEAQDLARKNFSSQLQEQEKIFYAAKKTLQDELFQMYKTARRGLTLCKDILALQDGSGFDKAYKKTSPLLASIDKALRKSSVWDVASLTFPSQQQLEKIYQEIDKNQDSQRISLEKTRILYQNIMDCLADYKNLL